jgi:hypothetical protein
MREARHAVDALDFDDLAEALNLTTLAATSMGAGLSDDELNVQLDPSTSTGRASSLTLHRGSVPVAASGVGTRRLLGLAIQSLAVREGAILLIDEIESGLEPHRLRHLLRVLRESTVDATCSDAAAAAAMDAGQVLLTTHSPVAVCELQAAEVHLARPGDSVLHIASAGEELQDLVRGQPEALLGRAALVCEGKTEAGLIRGLERLWEMAVDGVPLAELGVVVVDGGGIDKAARTAQRMADLGYRTLLFADSDHDPTPSVNQLLTEGVEVQRWTGSACTEEVLATGLPDSLLRGLMIYLVGIHGQHVLELLVDEMELNVPPASLLVGVPDPALRTALAIRAARHKWLKRVDWAEGVGRMLGDRWEELEGTNLAVVLDAVRAWVYA